MNGVTEYNSLYEFKVYITENTFSFSDLVPSQLENDGVTDKIDQMADIQTSVYCYTRYSFKSGVFYENDRRVSSGNVILASRNLYYVVYLVAKFNSENPSFMENGIYVAFNPDDLPHGLRDWYDKVYKNEPNTSNH